MAVKPRIVSKRFSLAGAESNIDFGSDFSPILHALYQKVRERLDGMQGLAQPVQMIGFWHIGQAPDGRDAYRYFAGVEADTAHVPEGLIAKNLPESLFAVFTEQKRGEMGSPEGYAYKWLSKSSMYEPNEMIRGDFEVFKNLTDTAPDCEAEIYIPIKAK